MKLITKRGLKRIAVLLLFLAGGFILFNSFCCFIEVPPYVVKKTGRVEVAPAKVGKGELVFEQEIPILILRGSPQELGAQQGELLKSQLNVLIHSYVGRFLSQGKNLEQAMKAREIMKPFIPPEYMEEIESMSQASGVSINDFILLHTMIDDPRLPFCSVIIASPPATNGQELIFGRNLDFPSLGLAVNYNMITVYHPDNKKSFASITWPGLAGVISGINQDGLSLAMLVSFDGTINDSGMPTSMLFRKILEEASDIEKAIEIVKAAKRTAPSNLALADAKGRSAVIEFTSENVVVRHPENGIICATNWFVTPEMKMSDGDDRYNTMAAQAKGLHGKIGHNEIINILKSVPIPLINLQSMVIYPQTRTIYLACGKIPATKAEYKKIDLAKYLEDGIK
jgi:predicted choloylglycine hydrolase